MNTSTLAEQIRALVFLTCLVFVQVAHGGNCDHRFFGTVWKSGWTTPGAADPLLGTLFDQATPENAGKWGNAEPTQGQFKWAVLDAMYNFAETHSLVTKQHTFVWGQQQPNWVNNGNAKNAVSNWIHAYMTRYGDKVNLIDVVNEPLHAQPSYKNGLGGEGATGWDWLIWVFEQARREAPNAKLHLNDYNILRSSSSTATYRNLVQLLKSRGLIDGIGEQGHFLEGTSAATLKANLDTLAKTGLPIYISEYDVNKSDDQQQLAIYQAQFPVFWEHPGVRGVTLWGHKQNQIWRSDAYLVRSDGTERPALTWLRGYMATHIPTADADRDGMVDLWEFEHFSAINAAGGGPREDADGDTMPNIDEYIAGTDPADAGDVLRLDVTLANGLALVSFDSRTTSPGQYAGDRHYRLEQCTNLVAADWIGVNNHTNAIGNDSRSTYTNSTPAVLSAFYRLRVWID